MFRKIQKLVMMIAVLIASLSMNSIVTKATIEDFSRPEFIELLDQIIEAETRFGLSGVQLAVYKDGKLIKDSAYGYTNNYMNVYDSNGNSILDQAKALEYEDRNAVTSDTLFDMASNTKMYATVFAMQKLVSEGKVSLDDKIKDIFPKFTDYGNENGWKDLITVRHTLSHYAGFAPDPQYHNENYDEDDGIPNGKNDLFSQDKETTFEMIMKTPIQTQPGTSWAYSDVDMMLAGFIVEHITGQNLDTYVKENFYNPLNLDKITFNPLEHGFSKDQTSSSELHGNTRDGRINFKNVRQEVVTGEVHDEKAFYAMGGVSGHAGLFGTASQVAYLAQAMFDGKLNGVDLFDKDTIDSFTKPAALLTQTDGGWRRKSETGGAAAWFSKYAPAGTIGHTGWTGTNTLIDKDNKLTLALFTNARNTPIMGPDANTFYNANSNISSYGAVSEFVYRALGFGDESAHEVFENMLLVEIPADLASVSSSKRNVVRSLIDVLETRAATDIDAKELLESNKVQDTILVLERYEAEDLKFLIPTTRLETLIDKINDIDKTLYLEDGVIALETLANDAKTLLESSYLEDDIVEYVVLLEEALNALTLKADKSSLDKSVKEARDIDRAKYTESSLEELDIIIEEALTILEDESATQEEVDNVLIKLNNAIDNLEVKEPTVPKEKDPKPDEKESEPEEEDPKPEEKDPTPEDKDDVKPNDNSDKDVLPQTGSPAFITYIASGLITIAIFIYRYSKKRFN